MKDIVLKTWTGDGSVTLSGDCVYVDYLKKKSVIPVSQIISFDIKDPKGTMRPGMITIRLSGSSGMSLRLNSLLSVGESNNIEFPHAFAYAEAAHEMQRAIVSISSRKDDHPSESPADEIRKYKSLLDDGIITQEEFDKKKKQLLGL